MAGSISLSLSQQFDSTGAPLSGGFLYFYAAGTTTPQSAYQDTALTLAWPNPIELDSAGRIPAFYLADGQIKIRLTDSAGVTQVSADNLLVVGASSGSGSPPSVDATTVFDTGDLKVRYGTGSHSGWVRANGRTIGSASSGGTERANADCQELFEYLWTADSNLSVSTGRGASANADWTANKAITLPDARGRIVAALDDMGSSAAGRLTSTYFGATATTLGAVGGSESTTLTAAQIPSLTSTGSFTSSGSNFVSSDTNTTSFSTNAGGVTSWLAWITSAVTGRSAVTGSLSVTSSGTSGNPHRTVQPTILATLYIKL
jgi:microcystin-dependent protein